MGHPEGQVKGQQQSWWGRAGMAPSCGLGLIGTHRVGGQGARLGPMEHFDLLQLRWGGRAGPLWNMDQPTSLSS